MEQYRVTGMSCAACSTRVEKAVSKVEGVTSCSVSLLTNSMGVEGTASADKIIAAVTAAGYGASLKGGNSSAGSNKEMQGSSDGSLADNGPGGAAGYGSAADDDMLQDYETPVLKRRLIFSLGFLVVLMYFSMGHMMWGFPVPAWFESNHLAMGLLQLLLATIIMIINQKFFISGARGLIHGAPNMDTLVALGSFAAYGWSVVALFLMSDALVKGDEELVMSYMDEFYFESAAMILTLITVGKMLEARSKGKTTDALKSLMKLTPKTAVIERDGEEIKVSVDRVRKGDIFLVRPGESIPVDGVVLEGEGAVNESALTGESIPVDKATGDFVSSGTINQSGFLRCEATRVGEDTTLSQIVKMVQEAAATKAPIAKIADKVSGVFVPIVITIGAITIAIWLLCGAQFGFALARGISVLVISCPCALGLATPVAIMVGNGLGAKNGILFKTAASLEEAGKIKIVALDKTGTITKGEPIVTDIAAAEGFTEEDVLSTALALEARSEHPLAKAILAEGRDRGLKAGQVSGFQALPGNGLTAIFDGKAIFGGSMSFIESKVPVAAELMEQAQALAQQGKTPLLFAQNDKLIGIIAVADVIKEDSPQAIKDLHDMGIAVVMLTGDNEKTANAIGQQAGVDRVIAGVRPDGKEAVIQKLRAYGKVAMVGDGINDAPALTRADVGIAIGAGTDVAIDAADVVLMKSRLSDVPAAIRLSRQTLKNIHENLFWAFFYNCIGIPLAAGVFIPILGWKLNPMFGAAAMSLSSFCVVSNALRLNFFKLYDKGNKEGTMKQSFADLVGEIAAYGDENTSYRTTITVEGMMCHHCENAVKRALEELAAVDEARADFESGLVTICTGTKPDKASIKNMKAAIKKAGYKVVKTK